MFKGQYKSSDHGWVFSFNCKRSFSVFGHYGSSLIIVDETESGVLPMSFFASRSRIFSKIKLYSDGFSDDFTASFHDIEDE